ncbi:MAG: RNA polymerase sigma factor [Candidatus Promineifilaceae bacterium]
MIFSEQDSNVELATLCDQRKKQPEYNEACMELFRRAIIEQDNEAWVLIYANFEKLIGHWISRKTIPEDSEINDLVHDAWERFVRYYSAEHYRKAEAFPYIVAYLRRCADTAVQEAIRKSQKEARVKENDSEILEYRLSNDDQSAGEKLDNESAWDTIMAYCKDEKERIVLYQTIVHDMKRREILKAYPHLFKNENDLKQVKQTLMKRLKRKLK